MNENSISWLKFAAALIASSALLLINMPAELRMLGFTVLIAWFWISEWIPLAATSLLPFVLFPLGGVVDFPELAESYMNDTILLFLGGFLLAGCLERWNVHKRIALKILLFSGKHFLAGFLFAAWILSMWISNTATAVMMVPIGLAVAKKLEENASGVYVPVLIAIAYGASIGGMATPVGTPPNLAFQQIYHELFPDRTVYSFSKWMILSLPPAVFIGLATLAILRILFRKELRSIQLKQSELRLEYDRLGPVQYEEKVAISVFVITALLWISRAELTIGTFHYPGWAFLFGEIQNSITDGKIAILSSLVLFFFPAKKENNRMLDDKSIQSAPWGILLLFGAGFAIASGFQQTGLASKIGQILADHAPDSSALLMLLSVTLMTFLTEFASNTASAQIFLPIIGSLSIKTGLDPAFLMIPVTWKASLAFMMPAGTPPNAIVFGSGKIRILDFIRVGFLMNVISLFTVCIWGLLVL